MRASPSVESQLVDVYRKGAVVDTCLRQGGWVRLNRPGSAWMLVDGVSVGVGVLLEVISLESIRPPTVRFAATRAAVLAWPSPCDTAGAKCVHHVEVQRTAGGESERPLINHRGPGKLRIGKIRPNSRLKVRLLIDAGGVLLPTRWTEVETRPMEERQQQLNGFCGQRGATMDPFGKWLFKH